MTGSLFLLYAICGNCQGKSEEKNRHGYCSLVGENSRCLAEFAPAGAKKIKSVFGGGVYVAENTAHGAECATEGSARSGVQPFTVQTPPASEL